MAPPPPPPALMEELVEEILLRFPPNDPACLVYAALVCKCWRRIVTDPCFRRRFRELHRTPPMLGIFRNIRHTARFVPTSSFRPRVARRSGWSAVDARHGRVLLQNLDMPSELGGPSNLMVWDPITGEEREVPRLAQMQQTLRTVAVLCAAACGHCDHLDCHRGPFLVFFAVSDPGAEGTFIYTYSSDAGVWSDPISIQHHDGDVVNGSSVLVGNALYSGFLLTSRALKYDLESHEMSLIRLPHPRKPHWAHKLMTLGDGRLGCATVLETTLYVWSRMGGTQVDAGWTQNRVIELTKLLPNDSLLTSPFVSGFVDRVGVIFLTTDDATYTIDLKTLKVNKVYEGSRYPVIPYTSFHTPALGAASTGGRPRAGD